jgi:hypothetical protein
LYKKFYYLIGIDLSGQYQVLHRYIKMVGRQEKDAEGNFKYFTNIVTGQYFTCDPRNPQKITLCTQRNKSTNRKQVDLNEKTKTIIGHILTHHVKNVQTKEYDFDDFTFRKLYFKFDHNIHNDLQMNHYNPIYEEYFLKQIIKYQQFLMYFRYRVSTCLSVNK